MNKLNLGAGDYRREGFVNVDVSAQFLPDVVCDVESALPFKENSIDEIVADHVLEHVADVIAAMNEIGRVCKAGGVVRISVPHQSSLMAYADPTHRRIFNEESFGYFCVNCEHYWIHESYGISAAFELLSQKVVRHPRYGLIRVELRATDPEGGCTRMTSRPARPFLKQIWVMIVMREYRKGFSYVRGKVMALGHNWARMSNVL